jgi:cation diffusion facilitator CzcD-associated flavoprotein CzcO
MRYFKRYWDESRGDAHDAWGGSWWYFETSGDGVVTRQVEVYDHGPTLRYDKHRLHDEFGRLSDKPLELGEFAGFEIAREEFERVWGNGV